VDVARLRGMVAGRRFRVTALRGRTGASTVGVTGSRGAARGWPPFSTVKQTAVQRRGSGTSLAPEPRRDLPRAVVERAHRLGEDRRRDGGGA
jgi:hypothetical protein